MKVNGYALDMSVNYQANIVANNRETDIEQNDTLSTSYGEDRAVHKTPEVDTQVKERTKILEREITSKVLSKIHQTTVANESAGILYDYTKFHQKAHISMQGVIKTDQGEYTVDINVNLSSEHRQIQATEMVDPLVINLKGTMPWLSSNTFEFDIDADGKIDQISQLKDGNGFLALDKNGNGKIDDGSELFGPTTGSGLSELKLYDEDNDGFIDENDPIFDQLRVWLKSDSESKLVALGEVGIGAIFIEGISNNFIEGNSDGTKGLMKNNSFVLFESGRTGIMAEYDFGKFNDTKEEIQSQIGILQQMVNARNFFGDKEQDTPLAQNSLSLESSSSPKGLGEQMDKLLEQLARLKSKLRNETNPEARQKIQIQIAAIQGQLFS